MRSLSAVMGTCYRFGLAGRSRFPGRDGQPRDADYTRRRGIDAKGCELPAGADESWSDPLTWANRIEEVDYRSNSRQFRDDVLGIPRVMVEAGQAETVPPHPNDATESAYGLISRQPEVSATP